MKKFSWLVLLSLTGCAWGYHVDQTKIYPCEFSSNGVSSSSLELFKRGECSPKIVFRCGFIKPLFFFDNVKAYCDTKEECTRICLMLDGVGK